MIRKLFNIEIFKGQNKLKNKVLFDDYESFLKLQRRLKRLGLVKEQVIEKKTKIS